MAVLARLRGLLPWWCRIVAKMVLSRLPLGGRMWQRLGLFSPGGMDDPDYACSVFDHHYRAAGAPLPGFAFLELGPGDSLASAVVGRAYGAKRGWLIDSGSYASRDMELYRRLAERLEAGNPGADLAPVRAAPDPKAMLAALSVHYLESGLAGLCDVPGGSCDMLFSQAVLEHVPREEFAATMVEIYRILKHGGVSTHQVDFRDHLGGGLNNLRFTDAIWEAPCFSRRSGFYTNRIRLSEMMAMMRAAGFTVEVAARERWERLPISRPALELQFRSMSDDDLATWSAFIVLRKA
ncbi:MAG: methyltransferase domain-containing protein [Alphaproteobacteria bacterium]